MRTWTCVMIAIATLLAGSPATAVPLSWSSSVIDAEAGASVGRHTSLVIAQNGTAYVSYLDESAGLVKLATSVAGGWLIEVVDSPGFVRGDTSLALDSSGNLHLVYFNALSSMVRYGTRRAAGGPWNLSDIDRGLDEGHNRLAVDRFGVVHLVYVSDNGTLRYARRTTGFWTREIVDPFVLLARYASIAVDGNGRPHLAYYGNGRLRYAFRSGGFWSTEVVDLRDFVGWFASIGTDPSGEPHIAYYDSIRRSLNYAVRSGTAWSTEVVDAAGDAGWDVSLLVDRDGVSHISYYARISADLRYATGQPGGWDIQVADEPGVVGWSSSVALDPAGLPRITYFDWSVGSLKYAVGQPALGARTVGATSVAGTSAVVIGEVTALGPYASANASFQWRRVGEPTWRETAPVSISTPGTFQASLEGLLPGARYEYRAVVEAGGLSVYGLALTFATPAPPPINLPLFLLVFAVTAVASAGIAAFVVLWFRRR